MFQFSANSKKRTKFWVFPIEESGNRIKTREDSNVTELDHEISRVLRKQNQCYSFSPNYSLETHEKVDEFSKLTRKEKPNKEIFKKMKNGRDFFN